MEGNSIHKKAKMMDDDEKPPTVEGVEEVEVLKVVSLLHVYKSKMF